MQSVVELPGYLSDAETLLGPEVMRTVIDTVAINPEAGQVIQGTGGFRKLRAARPGMGKRGGARVIYIYRGSEHPVFLVKVYAKNEKENLSMSERKALKNFADAIFDNYGVKR